MVVVREAVIGDAEALGVVHVRAWQEAYASVMPSAYLDGLDPVARAAMWHEVLDHRVDDQWVLLVAEDESHRVIGFAGAGPDRDGAASTGELQVLNVDPAGWGHGYGPALLSAAMAWLGDRYDRSVLWVVDANPRARRAYERAGWTADGASRDDEVLGAMVREVRYRWSDRVASGEC